MVTKNIKNKSSKKVKKNLNESNMFKLISDKTKLRVKGLIEKRLTTKTILIFAQEYESYDPEIRKELMAYITFLFNEEEEKFHKDYKKVMDPRAQHLQQIRWLELSEKRENIKKIQEILIKSDPEIVEKNLKVNTKPPVEEEKENLDKKTKKSKPLKIKTEETKIDKMLREAQLREENEAVLRQKKLEQEKLKKEQAEKERLLKAKKAKELKEKKANTKPKSIANDSKKTETKTVKPNTEEIEKAKLIENISLEKNEVKNKELNQNTIQKEKEIKTSKVDRNYEREQAEKEKLWKELYGTSRNENNKTYSESDNTTTKKSFVPTDKTPTLDYDELTHFIICGRSFDFDEYSNPSNRYFNFWRKMARKFRMSNLTVWLSLNTSKQPKLLKKRLKIQKKIERKLNISSNNSKTKSIVENKINKKELKKQEAITKNESIEVNE
ncbi:hypothetical protein SLITO_v1c03170 [Spiroplasma litorale]|uniref:Uncharacterized protein n=1 Tax=Spiroplasma litorale TaxID=216942 RepID=A0A0K1W1K3_9MOLU|nr:hypothetical protein [Spiroplasma litorale]AKX33972.1 hypothetical protein SLITO_v1c03170 [Spiroplasma litorale]